jgi:hypothetical protein
LAVTVIALVAWGGSAEVEAVGVHEHAAVVDLELAGAGVEVPLHAVDVALGDEEAVTAQR